MITICAVVLSWENPEDTIKCAESIVVASNSSELIKCYIIVVDNGSSATTVSVLSRWHQNTNYTHVEVIYNDRNLGYSTGMNSGIRHIFAHCTPDFIWLLNNDILVDPGAIDALLKDAHDQKDVAIWGPTVLSTETRKVECAGGCRYSPAIGYAWPAYAGMDAEMLPEKPDPQIDYIYGAAMFIKGAFLERTNGLDDQYFLYYEELELVGQLAPHENYNWCRRALVYHIGAGSSSLPGVEQDKTRHAAASALRYTWRHHPYYLPLVFLARFFGILVRGVKLRNAKLPLAVLAGAKEFLIEISKEKRLNGKQQTSEKK